MGIVNKPNTYVAGNTITAAEVNANEDTLYTLVNGNIDADNVDTTAIATVTGTQTLTNKTLTSPTINTGALTTPRITTSIDDSNGNEIIKTPATASAVNEITITNAATGNTPNISATGGDTNIHLALSAKGNGLVKTAVLEQNYAGTNTYRNNAVVLTGWGIIEPGGSVAFASESVSFGITFSTTPIVVLNAAGRAATSTTALGSFNGNGIRYGWMAHTISTTGFSAEIFNTDAADGNIPDFAYAYTWTAIGTLS